MFGRNNAQFSQIYGLFRRGGEVEKSEGGRGNARKQTEGRTEYMKEIALMNIYAFLSLIQTFRQQNWKIAGNDVVSKICK